MDRLCTTVVILSAGRGTRMGALTDECPKPLLTVAGKNLIEWKLLALPEEVSTVIIVIGYQGEQIRAFFGNSWRGKTTHYVVQQELNGTAGALLSAKELLGERFLVMMGDDLYTKEDVEKLMARDWGVCVAEVHNKEMKGEILVNDEGNFVGINEEIHFVKRGLMNTGLYMLRREIFNIPLVPIGGSSTEFGLPHTLAVIAKDIPVSIISASRWMQITTSEDLLRAEKEFFL